MLRSLAILLLIAVIAAAATGCGRKAAPEHPAGSEFPRRYPAW